MTQHIATAIQELTANVQNAQSKPILRSTIALGLRDMGYEPQDIEPALDEFFKSTIH